MTDAVFLNQLAWRLAAGIAAGAALLAVVLTSRTPSAGEAEGPRSPAAEAEEAHAAAAPATAAPASAPAISELGGGDLERAIAFCVNHVTTERSFVVFSNGTCVIVDEPTEQPIVDAVHTLEECAGPNARFITREIEDGHFLVTYRGAAFNCLFADEIEAQRPVIEARFLDFLTSAEKQSMADDFDPPFHAKLGLLARTRLNGDARDLSVAKVIRARPLDPSPAPQPAPENAEPSAPLAPLPSDLPPIVPPLLPGASPFES